MLASVLRGVGTMLKERQLKDIPTTTIIHLLMDMRHERYVVFQDKIFFSLHLPPFPSKAYDRFVAASIKEKNGEHAPGIVNISVTPRCMYNCWHCSASPKTGEDLPLNIIKDTIHTFQDLGTHTFSLTGGEPMLRDDLAEIIASVDDRSNIFMFTTAFSMTEDKAKELKQAGLRGIMVSLDHYTPEVHDKLRGYPGAYDILVQGVKNAEKAGLYVGLSCVVTKEMIATNTMNRILAIAKDLDVQEVMYFEPTPVGKLFTNDADLLTTEERQRLIDFHKTTSRDHRYRHFPKPSVFPHYESKELMGCTAGFNLVYIDANGNIRPCDFVPLTFGNILKEKPEVIWQRMNTLFQKPRSYCFMLENYRLMRKVGNGEYPLPYEKSREVCTTCPASEIPQLYKTLGLR
jgi:MoaA/NifB/PqqE/SkfB family radical SAM enzyme